MDSICTKYRNYGIDVGSSHHLEAKTNTNFLHFDWTCVMYHTLRNLAEHKEQKLLKDVICEVHLLGGAVGNCRENWKKTTKCVQGWMYNYFSKNDLVLDILYRLGTVFSKEPIGISPIPKTRKIVNCDITSRVFGHMDFITYADSFLRKTPKGNQATHPSYLRNPIVVHPQTKHLWQRIDL